MRHLIPLALLCASAGFAAAPPKTRVDNVTETLHGVRITDPYRWLEDQSSPETRAWIAQQNTYARALLDAMPGRERLKQRIAELTRVDSVGLPISRGGRYFFMKRLAAQNQAAIVVREGPDGRDEVLIDPKTTGADANTNVNLNRVSKDGKGLVYSTRRGG